MKPVYVLVLLSCLLSLACSGGGESVFGDDCGLSSGQSGIRICNIVATPTASESVILKNYGAVSENLVGWTLWDANALGNGSCQENLSGTIAAGGTLTFSSLPFQINDSGETITLKNSSNAIVDQRGN